MNFTVFENIEHLKSNFNFINNGVILEPDIHSYADYTDDCDRKYHDAEVLTTIMANLGGDCLEIGTSMGRGTYKLATNTSGTVFTLNALPEQISGSFVTHALTKLQIGSYLREKAIFNYQQIYDDSLTWVIPGCINDLSLVFVDGCHDQKFVYSDSRKVYDRIKSGGFIIWHDFNPTLRFSAQHSWIASCMAGVEQFCLENKIPQVCHLRDSWMGFFRKP
jgi:hypothetical protein